MNSKLRARIKRTLIAANSIDGRGRVVAVVFRRHSANYIGVAVRELQYGMDCIEFALYSDTLSLRFLQKQRVILP